MFSNHVGKLAGKHTGHHTDWMVCHTASVLRMKSRACAETRDAHLHRKKRLVCIIRISIEEAREKLEVGAWGIEPIELACFVRNEGLKLTVTGFFVYAPLLRNIFVPGGRASIPAFKDANASSSGVGGLRQLCERHRYRDRTQRRREERTSSSSNRARNVDGRSIWGGVDQGRYTHANLANSDIRGSTPELSRFSRR